MYMHLAHVLSYLLMCMLQSLLHCILFLSILLMCLSPVYLGKAVQVHP